VPPTVTSGRLQLEPRLQPFTQFHTDGVACPLKGFVLFGGNTDKNHNLLNPPHFYRRCHTSWQKCWLHVYVGFATLYLHAQYHLLHTRCPRSAFGRAKDIISNIILCTSCMYAYLKFPCKLGKTEIYIYKTVINKHTSIVSLQFGAGAVASKVTTKVVWWMGWMNRRHWNIFVWKLRNPVKVGRQACATVLRDNPTTRH